MRTVGQSLAWKEWHEHKWRLLAMTVVICGVALFAMADSTTYGGGTTKAFIMSLLAAGPLAVFVGAGTATRERSRGTLAFLEALPVPLWRVAIHKIAFGLLTAVGPSICLVVLLILLTRGSGAEWFRMYSDAIPSITGHWLLDWGVCCAAVSASLFIWTATLGARRSDEVSAGAIALVAMVGWWTVLLGAAAILVDVVGRDAFRATWQGFALLCAATAPVGFTVAFERGSSAIYPLALLVAVTTHAGLILWYVRRFGGAVELQLRSPRTALQAEGRSDWLGAPLASPAVAIAWKQARESGPLVLAGLAGIVGIVATICASNWYEQPERFEFAAVANIYGATAVSLGTCLALVAGIGVALADSESRVSDFWRSRPISPDLWFWTKFTTGLVLLFAMLYLPAAALAVLFNPEGVRGLLRVEFSFVPALHAALFATSLALTCLLRQAIYAAVLAIAVIYLGLLPAYVVWGEEMAPEVVAISLLAVAALATLAGWLSVRNEWGRRG